MIEFEDETTAEESGYVKKEEMFKFMEWVGSNYEYNYPIKGKWTEIKDRVFGKQYSTEELYKLYQIVKNQES